MKYEYMVFDEEVDFEPIEAKNIASAAKQVREILKNPSVWAHGTEPFTGRVRLWQTNKRANVRNFQVDCAQQD